MAPSHPFKFGNATIAVENEDFADGYSNGFVGYPDGDQPLTVEAIRRLIVENLSDLSETPTWNTGYILGGLVSLYAGSHRNAEPNAPQVQLGPVTLHLNRWRFRDGYATGQQTYEARRRELSLSNVVTARELLDTIAHHDPVTQTYHLGADELTALEDILGQLVGYLCAALFSPIAQESVTEPLPNPTLQTTS